VRSPAGAASREARARITGASADDAPASTLNFDLPGQELRRDGSYTAEIIEPAACAGLGAATRFPATGEAPLRAIATGPLRIRVIPLRYQADGSDRLPDTSAPQLERARALLTAMFPVSAVELDVRAPHPTTVAVTADTGWSTLLQVVRDLRAADRPPPDLFYFGLVAPAASIEAYCGPSCIAGISYRPSGSKIDGRVSVGLGFTGPSAAEGMAHELGHALGRRHAPCGGVKDADLDYPHAEGDIGVWGFDERLPRLLLPPASKDIMGYCGPRWVSDYTFGALAARLAEVNATSRGQALTIEDPAEPEVEICPSAPIPAAR
jgi:hypothetical protein